jgi:hypothetical protein
MTRRATLRLEAELEVLNAAERHEVARPGYAARFLAEFDSVVANIERDPLTFPEVEGSVRRALLRRFRYAVYFRVVDDAEIDVLAWCTNISRRVSGVVGEPGGRCTTAGCCRRSRALPSVGCAPAAEPGNVRPIWGTHARSLRKKAKAGDRRDQRHALR